MLGKDIEQKDVEEEQTESKERTARSRASQSSVDLWRSFSCEPSSGK